MPDPKPSAPPPPLLVPASRWRLSSYLAELPVGGRPALTLDEVRVIIPRGWASSPAVRLRTCGYAFFKRSPRAHLTGDSTIWARAAEPDEVALGELVRAEVSRAARDSYFGVSIGDVSWHLPAQYSGSGTLRRWRRAREGDGPEVQKTIRGAVYAPGDELVLNVGASPETLSGLVKAWIKTWAPLDEQILLASTRPEAVSRRTRAWAKRWAPG